jgi:endogenous inhibitor of DNA gyrase (YacG/DUF329 family)
MADRKPPEAPTPPPARTPRCPVCGRPAVQRLRPFCSARCADVDLGRWLAEGYAVPAGPPET